MARITRNNRTAARLVEPASTARVLAPGLKANAPALSPRAAGLRAAPPTAPSPSDVRAMAARAFVAHLSELPAWRELSPETTERLTRVLGGSENGLSLHIRGIGDRLVHDSEWNSLEPRTQAKMLSLLLSRHALPETLTDVTNADGEKAKLRRQGNYAYGPSRAVHHDFGRGPESARRQILRFSEGHSVEVIGAPSEIVDRNHTPEEVADALLRLPPAVRRHLKRIVLHPRPNPQDAFWNEQFKAHLVRPGTRIKRELQSALAPLRLSPAQRETAVALAARALRVPKDEPGKVFRSAATANVTASAIDLYPDPDIGQGNRLALVMLHELGHFKTVGAWGAQAEDDGWEPAHAATANDALPAPTRYGTTNIFEWGAETLTLQTAFHRPAEAAELRRIFPNAYRVMGSL